MPCHTLLIGSSSIDLHLLRRIHAPLVPLTVVTTESATSSIRIRGCTCDRTTSGHEIGLARFLEYCIPARRGSALESYHSVGQSRRGVRFGHTQARVHSRFYCAPRATLEQAQRA